MVDDRVYAGISERHIPEVKEEEGRTVKDTDAGDGGRKATGNHLSTFSKNMASQKWKPRTGLTAEH